MVLAVIALGGNALAGPSLRVDTREMLAAAEEAARALRPFLESGGLAVVTHGNGPQAGYLDEAISRLPRGEPRQPLWAVTAMTQGWIGHVLKLAFEHAANRRAEVVVSRVVVRAGDPEFSRPSKPIGRLFSESEARELESLLGWKFAWDPRGGYRRVVPSPRPLRIVEAEYIAGLAASGFVAIAAGGGGVPVVEDGGVYRPVEAIVDKDLSSSVLARQIDADLLAILTDVPGVAVNYGRPGERWLKHVSVDDLERLAAEGHFTPGSMGPKVEAAIGFTRETGRPSVIAHLKDAAKALRLEAGTIVMP